MKNYWSSIKTLIQRLLLVLLIYQLCRIVFYFYNKDVFHFVGLGEFLGGIRFDLSAIFYTNALFILAHAIPGKFKYGSLYQKILKISFFVVNLIFIATNFIDVEYYKFTTRRSTFSLITASGMENDLPRLLSIFLTSYWPLVLGFVLLAIIFWKLIPNLKVSDEREINPPKLKKLLIPYLVFIVFIALIPIIGRGGLQRVPLKIVHAIQYTDRSENTALVLNTPFSILKTISKKENLKKLDYFSEAELSKLYNPVVELKNEDEFLKKNLVLIILESFGEENIFLEFEGRKLTPFVDSLTQNSLYFTNAYANGRKSIDAVPSTITSIPGLMEVSYISSPYSFNKVDGFNKVLKEEGYKTAFFHGAFNGSQNFHQFSSIASFDEYYGRDEYGSDVGEDGVWGIFDEEFLQFSALKINEFKQPFFATIFTISSHVPYTIPEKYINKFPKGNRRIHESVAYADMALKRFFETVKKQSWYANTIFVITPDHTSGDDKTDLYYTNAVGNYKIPMLIIDPSKPELKEKENKLISQIDILPETLNYLNYSGKIFSFGNHPLATKDRLIANYNEGLYHFIIDKYYVCFDGNKIVKVCDVEGDKLLENNLKSYPQQYLETKIKSYIQNFNNRIIQNETTLTKS